MRIKRKKIFQVISGWDAVEILLKCSIFGIWQLMKIAMVRLWRGHRRKSKDFPSIELTVDSSLGTHCYIKIMNVKYHYVEMGPKTGQLVLVLGDAPDPGLSTPAWTKLLQHLSDTDHRIITLDLRGSGGSEGGNRVDLSPPRVVEEMHTLLRALGASENNPAVVIGQGIGGMVAWYIAHCHGALLHKLVVIDAPHPSLYWQYPPAEFCQNSLHFIQWPYLAEQWLAEGESFSECESPKWANSRAQDWSGALNYVRGAAWWRISQESHVEPPTLVIGRGQTAAQLVSSAQYCSSPALRLIQSDADLPAVVKDFLIVKDRELQLSEQIQWRGGLMGRVLEAVAGRGRELSARLLPPQPALNQL